MDCSSNAALINISNRARAVDRAQQIAEPIQSQLDVVIVANALLITVSTQPTRCTQSEAHAIMLTYHPATSLPSNLPAEVRNKIYELVSLLEAQDSDVFGVVKLVRCNKSKRTRHPGPIWHLPSFLRADKKINAEATPIYLNMTTFSLYFDLDKPEDVKRVAEWASNMISKAHIKPDQKFSNEIRLRVFKANWRFIHNFVPIVQLLRVTGLKAGIVSIRGGEQVRDLDQALFEQQISKGKRIVVILGKQPALNNAFRTLMDVGEKAYRRGTNEAQFRIKIDNKVKEIFSSAEGRTGTVKYEQRDGLTFGPLLPRAPRLWTAAVPMQPVPPPPPPPPPPKISGFVSHPAEQDTMMTAFSFAQRHGFPASFADFAHLAWQSVVRMPAPALHIGYANVPQDFAGYVHLSRNTRKPAVFRFSNGPQITVNFQPADVSSVHTIQGRAAPLGHLLLGGNSVSVGLQQTMIDQARTAAALTLSWVFPPGYVATPPVQTHAYTSTAAMPPSIWINPRNVQVRPGLTAPALEMLSIVFEPYTDYSDPLAEFQVISPLVLAADDDNPYGNGSGVDAVGPGEFDGGMDGMEIDMVDWGDGADGMDSPSNHFGNIFGLDDLPELPDLYDGMGGDDY
ncbi:hypothetical protein LTR91_019829 [Friedmanniomyces endolithicus]|uniref:F-box domain-containing protein n=1 Tax=Friedmanniomyces endolithicus TaxID=329885 RepID=A0AAN6HA50_9PEZI|nr:hypothetical protein LTR94_010517 [Friedmanniomyces endolithicus]KAK0793625.1 hypothetical protein LTR38_009499 [Friedmanniomyces endolithicus]KAK0796862.1 hypothetical protein LTR59_007003 [Friedmanniomyces endolithicus]KAK0807817.1 hypothetical protein LTR75_006452 [Friedmanniomyces endolithicus]KAK0869446.1 hypothetical protein LTS02_003005 [Friedmanniomyces endolithicus]